MSNKLKCPLCGGDMEYKEVKNVDTRQPDLPEIEPTHVWICDQSCPAVVFEYWKSEDVDNLKKVLN